MVKNKYTESVKKIKLKPFPQELYVVQTSNVRASFNRRSKVLGYHKFHSTSVACTWPSDDVLFIYMFLPTKAGASTIVHESVHVLYQVMKHNGVTFEEEVWAYHLQELFEQIASFMYTTKKKKRGTNGKKT